MGQELEQLCRGYTPDKCTTQLKGDVHMVLLQGSCGSKLLKFFLFFKDFFTFDLLTFY